MHLQTLLAALSALVMGVQSEDWIMPLEFPFDDTKDFWWPIQKGANLVSMSVRGERDPANLKFLPLGPCAVQNIQEQECAQYKNNGTAKFGGSYAEGLMPGQSYFISIVWITGDESKNGTFSSPTFTMSFPLDPHPPASAVTSFTTTAKSLSTATSTKTVRVSLASTSMNASTFITTPNTATFTPVQPAAQVSTSPSTPNTPSSIALSPGAKAGIVISSIASASLLALAAFLLWRHSRKQNKPSELNGTVFTRGKDDPSIAHSDLNLSGYNVDAKMELPVDNSSVKKSKAIDLLVAYPQTGYTGPGFVSTDPAMERHEYVPVVTPGVAVPYGLGETNGVVEMDAAAKRASTYELDAGASKGQYQAYSPAKIQDTNFPEQCQEFVVQVS